MLSGNANISGDASVTNLKTNNIDIKSGIILLIYIQMHHKFILETVIQH